MNNAVVRIESLEITNFKNVGHGCLKLENEKKEFQSSVLGLYGQNGSGKTALIDALELLRLAFSGRPVPVYFADCVNVDSDHAAIKYGLKVQNLKENVNYTVFYEVSIRRDVEETEQKCCPMRMRGKTRKSDSLPPLIPERADALLRRRRSTSS